MRAIPPGNTYDKYSAANPVARRLVARFLRQIDALSNAAAPQTILDVGCGEGLVSARLHANTGAATTLGLDRESDLLRAAWAAHSTPGLTFTTGDAHALPHRDDAFDLVCAIEVLEQVRDPAGVFAELSRVARRHVLVSVPREPIWRILNVARGAYLRSLGNPPGHIHHFSRPAFLDLCAPHGRVAATATPFPWVMVLLDVTQ